MEFLAPLMLLGAAGVAVPVIIHFTGRRRARVVSFAAFDFLMDTRRKTSRRLRLRELILLATRILICLAVPLVLAKPFATCRVQGPQVVRGPQAAVIIIDDGFFSAYDTGAGTLIERAKRHALDLVDDLGPEAVVAVMPSARDTPSSGDLSRDHLSLRDFIQSLRASTRPSDTQSALRRAGQLLAASNHTRRTVYLISVLAQSGFPNSAEPPWDAGDGIQLVTVSLRPSSSLANLAITDLSAERDPAAGTRGIRVLAEVANFSAEPVLDREIRLRIDGRDVARGTVSVEAGARRTKQFLAALSPGALYADVVVSLERDALPIDDRRYARAELREQVRVLLVNGAPHVVRHRDELFYLEAALRPGDRGNSGTSVVALSADELDSVDLSDFDVMALINVRALARETVAALSAWLSGGGGLLITVGDNVDADAYNRSMLPLLPQRLRTAVDNTYGSRGAERAERAERLTKWDTEHPIFAIFSRDAPGLRTARFDKLFLLGTTTAVDERKVLARYTNGAAAVIEARSDKGRMLLFTSSVDRDWNDLAIHPGYLPLMQQMIRYLGRRHDRRNRTDIVVGESVEVPVTADDARLEVKGSDGTLTIIEGKRLEGYKHVRFEETMTPGFYRIWAADEGRTLRRRAGSDFAVNVDPRGSDPAPIPPSFLPAGDGSERPANGPPDSSANGERGTGDSGPEPTGHERRIELWHAIAAGLLLLLLMESLLLLR